MNILPQGAGHSDNGWKPWRRRGDGAARCRTRLRCRYKLCCQRVLPPSRSRLMWRLLGAGLCPCAQTAQILSRSFSCSPAIDRTFGRIDVLVNNAAVLAQQSLLEDFEIRADAAHLRGQRDRPHPLRTAGGQAHVDTVTKGGGAP